MNPTCFIMCRKACSKRLSIECFRNLTHKLQIHEIYKSSVKIDLNDCFFEKNSVKIVPNSTIEPLIWTISCWKHFANHCFFFSIFFLYLDQWIAHNYHHMSVTNFEIKFQHGFIEISNEFHFEYSFVCFLFV